MAKSSKTKKETWKFRPYLCECGQEEQQRELHDLLENELVRHERTLRGRRIEIDYELAKHREQIQAFLDGGELCDATAEFPEQH